MQPWSILAGERLRKSSEKPAFYWTNHRQAWQGGCWCLLSQFSSSCWTKGGIRIYREFRTKLRMNTDRTRLSHLLHIYVGGGKVVAKWEGARAGRCSSSDDAHGAGSWAKPYREFGFLDVSSVVPKLFPIGDNRKKNLVGWILVTPLLALLFLACGFSSLPSLYAVLAIVHVRYGPGTETIVRWWWMEDTGGLRFLNRSGIQMCVCRSVAEKPPK